METYRMILIPTFTILMPLLHSNLTKKIEPRWRVLIRLDDNSIWLTFLATVYASTLKPVRTICSARSKWHSTTESAAFVTHKTLHKAVSNLSAIFLLICISWFHGYILEDYTINYMKLINLRFFFIIITDVLQYPKCVNIYRIPFRSVLFVHILSVSSVEANMIKRPNWIQQ